MTETTPGPCAHCGHDPACGFASIGDDWYCHDDDHTCYSVAETLRYTGDFLAMLAPRYETGWQIERTVGFVFRYQIERSDFGDTGIFREVIGPFLTQWGAQREIDRLERLERAAEDRP